MKKTLALIAAFALIALAGTHAVQAWQNTEDVDGKVSVVAKNAPKSAPYAEDNKANNSLTALTNALGGYPSAGTPAQPTNTASDKELGSYAPAR